MPANTYNEANCVNSCFKRQFVVKMALVVFMMKKALKEYNVTLVLPRPLLII